MPIDYSKRIYGLDVVRAVAILLVMLSHSTFLIFPNGGHPIISIFQFFGAIGVDLFFVLSGFLIGGLLLRQIEQQKVRFKDVFYFWIRRWFRTLPNYFLILLLNILMIYLLFGIIIDQIGDFLLFIQNFSAPHPNFFTEAWSLSIEEYAYLIGPLLLFLLVLIFSKVNKFRLFLVTTLLIIVGVSMARYRFGLSHDYVDYSDWSQHIRKVVIFRIDSIYYGFIGAYVAYTFKSFWETHRIKLFFTGALLFITVHACILLFQIQPQHANLFYTVFYLPLVSVSILLLFPLCSSWRDRTIFEKQITKISILSYGLYLVNLSLILLPLQLWLKSMTTSIGFNFVILAVYWVLSFVFAQLLYRYYEKPMTDLRDSRRIKSYFK
ncbi:acyltransferase [Subsaximicrobium wynnwilliamsii]|uniref:Acyltransferase n=1 Tax=Subsaximicrobium wynnwilliamsii TaxID=291179 RepID=A0A5C6ZJA1_9FLAO|nr:acyltransferase [Subsaximicrobium wynnwilliamsii]TXD84235.1 acyltransferase [Subsaximicrobium wynnwilliamsii]TXD89856.1 acyltransferase [Subsaximicrobium wynnwilliamsii]TXE03947.1 acyltransferase [Subsaximicrobium wynnwilliamsii]